MLRPYYRSFENLPWTADPGTEAFFRKLWTRLLAACVILGLIIWAIDLPEENLQVRTSVPPRLAKIVIERETPPPPPPPPPPEIQEVPQPKPEVTPREPPPEQPKPSARERASKAGLLAFQDDLADLRQSFAETKQQLAGSAEMKGAVEGPSRSERSLITSRVGASSGGINTAAQSRGFGGGSGNLSGHSTTQVAAPPSMANTNDGVRRSGASSKPARSREEIELIFDRNKGAIYALYSRALRERPDLQGKMVLEFTIAPSGEVTMCRVVSSELNDPELERKIVARVRLFRFEPRDVEPITTTKPIDFFPSA